MSRIHDSPAPIARMTVTISAVRCPAHSLSGMDASSAERDRFGGGEEDASHTKMEVGRWFLILTLLCQMESR